LESQEIHRYFSSSLVSPEGGRGPLSKFLAPVDLKPLLRFSRFSYRDSKGIPIPIPKTLYTTPTTKTGEEEEDAWREREDFP